MDTKNNRWNINGTVYLQGAKSFLQIISHKGGKYIFTRQGLGDLHLEQLIKFSIIKNGIIKYIRHNVLSDNVCNSHWAVEVLSSKGYQAPPQGRPLGTSVATACMPDIDSTYTSHLFLAISRSLSYVKLPSNLSVGLFPVFCSTMLL